MKFMEKAKRFFTLNAANHEGFTLVELIVVIAILAILAGVAVPAYSGYIKRAEKAGDLQLLGAVNEAFAAACMAEGVDIRTLTADSAKMVITNGKIDLNAVAPAEVKDAFALFYKGNEDATFKVIEFLRFDEASGVFAEQVMSEGLKNVLSALTNGDYDDSIAALKGSVFNNIGYGTLAGQINNASDLLAGFYGHVNSGFHALLDSDANMDVLNSYLSDDEDKAGEIFDAMYADKLAEINADSKYNGLTNQQKENMAYGQLYANAAILTAAKNKDAIDDNFIAALGNGNAVSMLQGATDGGAASEDTIAQAAFAYAMYTSYQASQGVDVSGDVDIMDVYNVLGTEGFQKYMKNDSAADQAGYLGAMDLIAGSADNADSDLAKDILQNGFNSSELVALMQGVTK